MALSNWDTLAMNHEGKSCGGSFKSPLGVEVEFYKNWLYIRDKVAWQPGGCFMGTTIMEIWEGRLTYKDVHILAVRGSREAIYAVVWSHPIGGDVTGMAGVSLYGYEDDTWVGVDANSVANLTACLRRWLDDSYPQLPVTLTDLPLGKGLRYNQGDAYFADAFGTDVPATSPGEATRPFIG